MNKALISLPIVALIFLGTAVGAAMMHFEFGLYRQFYNAFLAAETVLYAEQRSDDINLIFTGAKPSSRYDKSKAPARDGKLGVTRHEPELSYAGLTIYSTGLGNSNINLVNMAGEPTHQWVPPLDEIHAIVSENISGVRKQSIHSTPFLYPNGDVLLVLSARGITPWGLGIAKLDKASNLLWFASVAAHHDVDVSPDGRIYTLGHFIDTEPRYGLENIRTPFLDDTVIVLSAEGELLSEFSVLDAIRDSEYQSMLRYANPVSYNGDLLHANSVQYVTATQAAASSVANEGDLLISLRNMDVVLLLNPVTEKVTWAARGDWHLQHDPDFLDNGNILVFDNQGDIANPGGSRVFEFNPETLGKAWEFPGKSGEMLYSSVKSSQQRLPNGNTLITETNNGRVLEVTGNNEIAWEFYIPERSEKNGDIFTKVVEARRYSYAELEFIAPLNE